ncbi:MAG: DNA-binding transcriptional regulator [Kiritimatiellae bacterium]|nr:DNA-binding transcriptional regulator [Kiritimatiellia bacterium]
MSVKVCRDMRRGVLRYVHRHGPWSLHIIEGRAGEQKLVNMRDWGCAGIIGRLYTPELLKSALSAHVPMVLMDPAAEWLRRGHPLSRRSIVRSDTVAVGRMAAEYFLERKFTNFAYVGEVHDVWWSVQRGAAFAQSLQAAGFTCHLYGGLTAKERDDAGFEREHLCAWLRGLPKPVALLAAMDNRGRQVLDACALAGISVPQEVALLGVDNDDDLCETTAPPMSSILLDAERISYEAMRHLDLLMRRATNKRETLTYGPLHVITRRSTETTQVSDPLVVRALEFITLNACSGIGVLHVSRHVNASRRLLEIRFRDELGHTILEAIQRVRIKRVCSLLRETNLPISEIVRDCGFDSESHVGTLFRRRFSCSMREYRHRS